MKGYNHDKQLVKCLNCKKEFEVEKHSLSYSEFCSKECRKQFNGGRSHRKTRG